MIFLLQNRDSKLIIEVDLRIIMRLFTSIRADDGDCAWTVDSQREYSISALCPGVVDMYLINSALKTEVVKLEFFFTN